MPSFNELEALTVKDLRKRVSASGIVTGVDVLRLKKPELIECLISGQSPRNGNSHANSDEGNGNGVNTPASNTDLASIIAQAISPFVNAQMDEIRVRTLVTEEVSNMEEWFAGELDKAVTSVQGWAIQQIRDASSEQVSMEAISLAITDMLNQALGNMVKTVQVITPAGERKEVGMQHKLFPELLDYAALGENVMLVGPAGGGKTHVCHSVAQALDLPFHFISVGPHSTKSDIQGFIDAHGNYHTTPFREAFEHGGVFLLDEVDAGNAGVLTLFNAALSNGAFAFPDKTIQKHENFICFAAANTYGRGADRQYVGRNQLDAATLDRFLVVDFDYDEDLERALAGHDTWVSMVQHYRKRAWDIKERIIISPRASIKGARLLSLGKYDYDHVEERVIWKGISPDIRRKIKGS